MKKLLIIILSIVYAAVSVDAQVTTSGLYGRVCEGSDDKPLAGVTVLVTHRPTGTASYAVSGENGGYHLSGLRSGGPYTVVFSFPLYAEVSFDNIVLALGEETRLDALLSAQELDAATISQMADRLALSRTGSSVNYDRKAIDAMPSIDRSLIDVIRYSPYANGMSLAGGDGRMSNFTVDGANLNNNYGLSSNLPGGGNPISMEVLDEIQIVVSPYDVRQSNFIGGGINSVTKSGSNTFRGNAYTYFTSQDMRGNRVAGRDLGDRDLEHDWIFGATVSGPIVKDKLFFFLNYEQENMPQQIIGYRARKDGEQPGGMVSRTLLSDMQKVSDFLKKEYNYDPGSATDFPGDNVNRKVFVRLDWNISDRHSLTLRYNYTFDKAWNAPNDNSADTGKRLYNTKRVGPDAMAFSGNMYGYNCALHTAVADWRAHLNEWMSNQLLATFTYNREYRDSPSTPFPHVDIMNVLADGTYLPYMSFGYELFSRYTDFYNTVINVKDDLSFHLEDHTIIAGLSFENQQVANCYMRNGSMYYRYNSLNDFLTKAAPESFALTYPFGGADTYYDKLAYSQLSLYLQDNWNVTPNLKLDYGIRVDGVFFRKQDFHRNDAVYARDYRDGKKIDTGAGVKNKFNYSPRIGFIWDALHDRSLRIKGGVGVFLGHIPMVYIMNVPSSDNLSKNSVTFQTRYAGGVATPDPRLAQFAGSGMITDVKQAISQLGLPTVLGAHTAGYSIIGIDENFRMPQTMKVTLGVDWTVPVSFPFVLSAEGIFNKTVYGCYLDNLSVDFNQGEWKRFSGADNRLIYPASSGRVAYLTNTREGYGVNAQFQVKMSPAEHLDLMAAYAFCDQREMTGFPATDLYSSLTNLPQVDGPAKARLQRTQFAPPHKVTASLGYFFPKVLGGDGLHLNLFYTAYSPFGYSYVYTNDMNGDGVSNDLMYIPRDDSEIIFVDNGGVTADVQRQAFWDFVAQDDYLRTHKGQYAGAFEARAPWVHRVDLSLVQDFSFRVGNRRHGFKLSATLVNLGNLLNSSWGVEQINSACNSSKILTYAGQNNDASLGPVGAPTYTMFVAEGKMPSTSYEYIYDHVQCWRLQIGLKYLFN